MATKRGLTDKEGALLAAIRRKQPITAYAISKHFQESPISHFNESKGQVYRMINHLADREFLCKTSVEADGRGTELWACTDKGLIALHIWIRELKPNHVILDDPLRTKIAHLDLLPPAERRAWVAEAKRELQASLEKIDEYFGDSGSPNSRFVRDNSETIVRSRMDWLDRIFVAMTLDHQEDSDPD